jgi:hypothetical protein
MLLLVKNTVDTVYTVRFNVYKYLKAWFVLYV